MRRCAYIVATVVFAAFPVCAEAAQTPTKKEAVHYAAAREKAVCDQDKNGRHDWLKGHVCDRPASGLSYKAPSCSPVLNRTGSRRPLKECYLNWIADHQSFLCMGTLTVRKLHGRLKSRLAIGSCTPLEG
jgi:hypothetical protein